MGGITACEDVARAPTGAIGELGGAAEAAAEAGVEPAAAGTEADCGVAAAEAELVGVVAAEYD